MFTNRNGWLDWRAQCLYGWSSGAWCALSLLWTESRGQPFPREAGQYECDSWKVESRVGSRI